MKKNSNNHLTLEQTFDKLNQIVEIPTIFSTKMLINPKITIDVSF